MNMGTDWGKNAFAADAMMLVAAVFWGAGYPVSSLLLKYLPSPLWILALRLLGGGLLMALCYRRNLRTLTLPQWKVSLGVGVIVALCFLFSMFGLVYSTPGKQSFIASINVVMVPFFYALLYRTRPPLRATAGAALTSLGLLAMAFTPGMRFNFGDFLSLLLAFCCAFHVLAVGWAARRMDTAALATGQLLGSGTLCLLAALAFETTPTWSSLPGEAWGCIVFLALFPSMAAFLIQSWAQRRTSESHAAILLSLEGLFGYLFTLALGQEDFRLQIAAGGALILLGVFLAESESFLTAKNPAPEPLAETGGSERTR
jgi:drug/metabolite transporter (DMT)-like permease